MTDQPGPPVLRVSYALPAAANRPRQPKPERDGVPVIVLAITVFLYGIIIAWFAVALAGAGHGWCSPAFAAVAGIVLMPIYGISLGNFSPAARVGLRSIVVIGMVLADAFLILTTIDGERSIFEKIWTNYTNFVVFWLCLWSAWQVGVVIHVVLSCWAARGESRDPGPI